MIVAIGVIAAIFGYVMIGGIVGGLAYRYVLTEKYGEDRKECALIVATTWPIALPLAVGFLIVRSFIRRTEREEAEKRQVEREWAELERELTSGRQE